MKPLHKASVLGALCAAAWGLAGDSRAQAFALPPATAPKVPGEAPLINEGAYTLKARAITRRVLGRWPMAVESASGSDAQGGAGSVTVNGIVRGDLLVLPYAVASPPARTSPPTTPAPQAPAPPPAVLPSLTYNPPR